MLLTEARWIFMGFILCILGAQDKKRSICVLKGSTVNLTCPDENPSSSISWYTLNPNGSMFHLEVLPEDENYIFYNATNDNKTTLTITNVKESNENFYCCKKSSEDPQLCWKRRTELLVTDLQVKVIPASEGLKVSLMCKTSCSPTETPAAFVWYQNRQYIYDDWSPWYQELVSSEKTVKYSCAVKGYEDHRAPEVSVDSVTTACFVVRYDNGKMCSHKQKSVDESCFIIYPRDLHVQINHEEHLVILTCSTSCPAADSHTAFIWYWNGNQFGDCESQNLTAFNCFSHVSCAVKENEDLRSHEICSGPRNCMNVNYISRSVCMLESSSGNISSIYSNASYFNPPKMWYKITRNVGEKEVEEVRAAVLVEDPSHIKYVDVGENQNTLRINDLKKSDSGEYMFSPQIYEKCDQLDSSGVMLTVTGLKVTMRPSAEVTEGQKVTLTCTTSCPLTDSTIYMWYFNNLPLKLPKNQNKHVIFNPVSSHHAGNYSCAVPTSQTITSSIEALTVKPQGQFITIMNIIKLAVLLLIPLIGFRLYLVIRRKTATADQNEQDKPQQVNLLSERFRLTAKVPPADGEQIHEQEDKL